jgi:hypothetical protein
MNVNIADLPADCQAIVATIAERLEGYQRQDGYLAPIWVRLWKKIENVCASTNREVLAMYLTRLGDAEREKPGPNGLSPSKDNQFFAWEHELLTGVKTCPTCWNAGEKGSPCFRCGRGT